MRDNALADQDVQCLDCTRQVMATADDEDEASEFDELRKHRSIHTDCAPEITNEYLLTPR